MEKGYKWKHWKIGATLEKKEEIDASLGFSRLLILE